MLPPDLDVKNLKPLQHFTPDTGSVALTFGIEPVNLHGSVQECPFAVLAFDCESAGP